MRSASLKALLASKLNPACRSAWILRTGLVVARALLELDDRAVVIAGAGQDHAQVEMELGVVGIKLDAAAERLDLVLVEHLE